MKGLIKKLFLPVAISAAFLMPASINAQEREEENLKPKSGQEEVFKQKGYLGIGIGAYNGSEQSMQDIYGTFPRFRLSGCRDISEKFNIEVGLAYAMKKGQPYEIVYGDIDEIESSAEMQMFQVEGLAKYVFRGKSADFYIGGGGTYIAFKEKVEVDVWYNGEHEHDSAEGSKSAFGPVLVLGVDFPINQDKTTFLYGQISGRSAKIEGAFGEDVDIGGGVLEAGIKFNTFTEK